MSQTPPQIAPQTAPVELLVCMTCRKGQPTDTEGPRPGALLYDALNSGDIPPGVSLRPVECLSNCDQGCSIVLRGGAGRWTYVYGNFDETQDADMILDVASRYHATADGLVPWRDRPVHFRKNCIARIPPIGDL
ncbi:DUF1636 domain-containing protein [Rhodobacteraceae bacterium F11138]|nr:DUF1636 domain-containing protein [Rhodobacteraceae bacterium F11138]